MSISIVVSTYACCCPCTLTCIASLWVLLRRLLVFPVLSCPSSTSFVSNSECGTSAPIALFAVPSQFLPSYPSSTSFATNAKCGTSAPVSFSTVPSHYPSSSFTVPALAVSNPNCLPFAAKSSLLVTKFASMCSSVSFTAVDAALSSPLAIIFILSPTVFPSQLRPLPLWY